MEQSLVLQEVGQLFLQFRALQTENARLREEMGKLASERDQALALLSKAGQNVQGPAGQ